MDQESSPPPFVMSTLKAPATLERAGADRTRWRCPMSTKPTLTAERLRMMLEYDPSADAAYRAAKRLHHPACSE
jgi:hypothetical protein